MNPYFIFSDTFGPFKMGQNLKSCRLAPEMLWVAVLVAVPSALICDPRYVNELTFSILLGGCPDPIYATRDL